MKFFLAVLAVVATMTGLVAHAAPTTLLVDDSRATQPAINDFGEVTYVKDGAVISTTRGFLVDGVDASNLGLSNNGEVVFADGSATSQVTSTTRGVLVSSRSFGPTISATSGEVAYISGVGDFNFFTTAQGQVEAFDRDAGFRVGVGDVNDLGEVVFELRQLPDPFTRIYSTVRGFLTPVGVNAIQPAINDFGEIVYSGFDSEGRQQIFSSVRGQLTFFGGMQSVLTADLPDIDNQGRVVFRGVVNGVRGLYMIEAPTKVSINVFPNSINPRSRGKIPVAILTTGSFDATTVDPTTVRFGENGTEAAPVQSSLDDADEDADIDLILHFNTQDTSIKCGDTSASLTGGAFDGQAIQGTDSIKTVGCK